MRRQDAFVPAVGYCPHGLEIFKFLKVILCQEKWTRQASKFWKVQWWGCLLTGPSTRLSYPSSLSLLLPIWINIEGELLVGCGDGELVMVVEGAVKKPPPGRVTFPTQVQLWWLWWFWCHRWWSILSEGLINPVEKEGKDDDCGAVKLSLN